MEELIVVKKKMMRKKKRIIQESIHVLHLKMLIQKVKKVIELNNKYVLI